MNGASLSFCQIWKGLRYLPESPRPLPKPWMPFLHLHGIFVGLASQSILLLGPLTLWLMLKKGNIAVKEYMSFCGVTHINLPTL